MKYLLIIGFILLISLIIMVFIGIHFLRYIVNPKKLSLNLSRRIENKNHHLDFIDEKNIINYNVIMDDSYIIPVYLIKNNSNKFVILSHGHTVTHYNSFKYAKIFYEDNYNVIMYDSRGHGDNEKSIITLGHLESKDLKTIINDTYSKYGNDIYLGIHGESMGAITSNLTLKYQQNIKFIISDSSFKDEIYHLKYFVKHMFNMPSFMVYFGSLACIIKYHFSFNSIAPIKYIKKNQIPICFIHGLEDDYILPENTKQLYEANIGYKELHLFDNAKHARCLQSNPELYYNTIKNFLKKVEVIYEK